MSSLRLAPVLDLANVKPTELVRFKFRKWGRRVALAALMWVSSSGSSFVEPAQAQDSVRSVTLPEVMGMFAQNNLRLRAAQAEAGVQIGLARQAAAYPNPVVTVSHEPLFADGERYSESYLSFGQRVEWPSLRRARINAAKMLGSAARARVAADSLELGFEVVSTYIGAVAEEANRRVLQETTEVIRRAESSMAARLGEGEASGYDLRRMRIELARYENALSRSELGVRVAQRRLALMVFPEGDVMELAPTGAAQDIFNPLSLDELLLQARSRRPEMMASISEVGAAEAALERTRKARQPSPSILAGYKRQNDGFQGVILGFSIGIPVFDRSSGLIMAEAAQLLASQTRHALTVRMVENDVRQSFATYESLSRRSALVTDQILAETGDLLSVALVGYREGEMTLIMLLDAANAHLDARLTGISLRAALRTSYYDLLRAAGEPMTSTHI